MKPLWLFFRNGEIGVTDLLVKREVFFLDAVFGALEAAETLGWVEIEVEGDRRLEILCGKVTEGADPLRVEAAGTALVSDGGIVESVAEYDLVVC